MRVCMCVCLCTWDKDTNRTLWKISVLCAIGILWLDIILSPPLEDDCLRKSPSPSRLHILIKLRAPTRRSQRHGETFWQGSGLTFASYNKRSLFQSLVFPSWGGRALSPLEGGAGGWWERGNGILRGICSARQSRNPGIHPWSLPPQKSRPQTNKKQIIRRSMKLKNWHWSWTRLSGLGSVQC